MTAIGGNPAEGTADEATYTIPAWYFGSGLLHSRESHSRQRGLLALTVYSAPIVLMWPAPTEVVFSPASGPTSGGTLRTVTGKGFGPDSAVLVGDLPCIPVTSTATEITCITPPGNAGNVTMTAVLRLTTPFTYIAPATPAGSKDAGACALTVTAALSSRTKISMRATLANVTRHLDAPCH